MELEDIDFSNYEQRDQFLKDLEAHIELGWNSANGGLIEKMRQAINEKRKDTTEKDKEDNKAFNDDERIQNLFVSKLDVNNVDAKHFLLDSVLNEFRQQKEKLSARTIDKMIRRFCFDDFKDLSSHRKDMYNFIEELLQFKPPVNTRQRWEWVCIITSKFGPDYANDVVVSTLDDFGKNAYKFIKENKRPHEYKLFLMNLLEYDYAALIARQNCYHKVDGQPEENIDKQQENLKPSKKEKRQEQTLKKQRQIQLSKFGDFDQYPLAYLLLCQFNLYTYDFSEMSTDRLTTRIIDLVNEFNPKEDSMEICRPYVRLVGLLLDVLLYVERDKKSSVHDVEDVTIKVQNLVRKIKLQHDGGNANSFEWRTFLDMCGVPWIRELDQVIKTSGHGRYSGSSTNFPIFNQTKASNRK